MRATLIIARLTWKRLKRGRSLWIAYGLAALPILFALVVFDHGHSIMEEWQTVAQFTLRLPVMLGAALLLATAVSEEVELKTLSYLWSRPISRTSVLAGKLIAIVPLLMLIFGVAIGAAWLVIVRDSAGDPELWGSLLHVEAAAMGGLLAASAFAAGAGAIFARHPFVFVIGYMLFIEQLLAIIPTLANISIAYHTLGLAELEIRPGHGGTPGASAIGLIVLAVIWIGVGVWRIENAEYIKQDQ